MNKSITIEIHRHALKGSGAMKDMLSPEGVEQAREIGKTMEGKGFTHILVSSYFRTAQTAAAFAEGAGDFTASKLSVSSALFTERLDEWMVFFKENGSTVKLENELIEQEAARMAADLRDELSTLESGAHILAVGHTPFIETLIYGLTGKVIAGLHECEGVEIEIDIDDDQLSAKLAYEWRL